MNGIQSNVTNEKFPLPVLLDQDGNDSWWLAADFIYIDPVLGRIIIPAGTNTDLYTIPAPARLLARLLSVFDTRFATFTTKALPDPRGAIVHDWIFKQHNNWRAEGVVYLTRQQADDVIARAMYHSPEKMNLFTRKTIMAFIRTFSRFYYNA